MRRAQSHVISSATNLHSNVDSTLRCHDAEDALPAFEESARLKRLDDQLRLAGALQRSLQRPPPALRDAEVRAFYSPADIVSGDSYDVVRLDESHVAMAVADATGHELAAGLLSTFVKRSLQGRRPWAGGARMLEPDEVLTHANRDILETQLEECQFVTAIYAIYNEQTNVIRWARAGAPYPILVPHNRPPRPLISEGPLLGVLHDARFEVAERKLEPGDTLVFHTDGLELLFGGRDDHLEPQHLHRAAWFRELCHKPIRSQLDRLQRLADATEGEGAERDDVTVLTLHVHDQRPTDAEIDNVGVRSSAPARPTCAALP